MDTRDCVRESLKQGMEQSEGKGEEEDGGWCCICGDVGFSDQLLRCPACSTRLQHTYCSRMYPNIEMERWQCEWCLHKDYQKQQQQKRQQQQYSTIATTRLKKRHRDRGEKAERRDHVMVGTSSKITVSAKKQNLQQHQQKESSSSVSSLRTCAGDRWRKPGCNSSPSRVVGRRYKLLADVLC